jgi:DNA-binding beta-propeller fold protein YncE
LVLVACDGPAPSDPPAVDPEEVGTFEIVPDWPRLPPGVELGHVLAVAVHPDGRVYVAHSADRESPNDSPIDEPPILVIDPESGELLDALGAGLFLYPHGLSFDDEGRLWVVDADADRVVRLDADGRIDLVLGAEEGR